MRSRSPPLPVRAGGSTTGWATALAVRYTGIDTTNPIDATTPNTGNSAALVAQPVTTTAPNDEVVRLYGVNGTTIGNVTLNVNGSVTTTGEEEAVQAVAGSTGTGNATTSASLDWIARTVALRPLGSSSISVARPTNKAANDLLLVTVTAAGLPAGGSICAPDATWHLVGAKDSQGVLTQATYWSVKDATDPGPYAFSFTPAGCAAGGSTTGWATALLIRYTGVDTTNPIDATTPNTGNSAALTAQAVTTTAPGDEVVRLYGVNGTTITNDTLNVNGSVTSTGEEEAVQAAAGPSGTGGATTPASLDWIARTVALRPLGSSSITVARPTNKVANDFLLVTVTAAGLPAGGSICAPDATWHLVGAKDSQGALTQATYWSVRAGAAAENYTFTFTPAACGAGGSTTGFATALLVRYTGVDTTNPIDATAPNTGTSATLTSQTVTTTAPGDEVVRLYGVNGTTIGGDAVNVNGPATSTGDEEAVQAVAGSNRNRWRDDVRKSRLDCAYGRLAPAWEPVDHVVATDEQGGQ